MKRTLCPYALAALIAAGTSSAHGAAIPWSESFPDAASLGNFTVIDANNDGKRWEYSSYNQCARMTYNGDLDMDDWLITPAFTLEKGNVYSFQLDARNSMGTERFEVFAGTDKTAEAMTIEVIPRTDVKKAATFSGEFTVPETGTYYIGIHGCSPADQLYLDVDNLQLKQGVSTASPEAVTALQLTPDPSGLDKVVISCVLPTLNIGGEQLGAIDKVEIACDNTPVATVTEGLVPGAPFSFTHEGAPMGRHTYTVTAYSGSARGRETTADVFTGPNIPASVRNPRIGEFTPGTVTISWDCPDKDIDGNPLNPSLVTYKVVTFEVMDNSLYVEEDIPGAMSITDTEFTHSAIKPGTGQIFTAYGVYAMTAAGKSTRVTTPLFPVGTPYAAPFMESFDAGKAATLFRSETVRNYQTVPSWDAFNDEGSDIKSRDAGNGFLSMTGEHNDDCARFYSGKISLVGLTRPTMSFYVYNFQSEGDLTDNNLLEVYVSDGTGFTLQKEITVGELPHKGWNRIHIDLADFAGKTVQAALQGTIRNYMLIPIDCISIGDLADRNLEALGIDVPDNVAAGRQFELTVNIENTGATAMSDYQVRLYRNGELLTAAAGPAVEPCGVAKVVFTDAISVIDYSDVTYTAEVIAEGDNDTEANTTAPVTVAVTAPKHPVPTALNGSQTDGSVSLVWSAPDFSSAVPDEITDDFESYESYATGSAGGWIFTDNDGKQVGKLDLTIPNVTYEGSVQSFWVMDATLQGANSLYAARSGNKYLAQIFNNDNSACDDWAISPALYEGGQTVSFHAKSYSSYPAFAEQFEVLYSTGSTDIADFILMQRVENVPNAWTRYEFTLPEGAARFAIRCTSAGCYMLFIDDFTYMPATGSVALELLGYNIYRNGERINDAPVSGTSFTDADAPDGTLRYSVTALYDKGESMPSEEFSTAVNGIGMNTETQAMRVEGGYGEIRITGAAGQSVTVYSADGMTVASVAATAHDEKINVVSGIYIVKAGTTVCKVMVR